MHVYRCDGTGLRKVGMYQHGVSRGEPMAQEVDQKQLRKLLAEKLPQREMARRLKIPRSTLQRIIKGMDAPVSPQGSASDSGNGLPVVDTGKLTPAEADAVRADFWELIEWWRERKLQRVYESTPRET